MKKNLQAVPIFAVLFSLTCVMSASYAQDQIPPIDEQNQQLPSGRKAKTIPNSETIITLRFGLENGDYIIASQRDGGMIRIEKGDKILGFTPYKLPDGNVSVRVFQIDRVIRAGRLVGERMVEQETLDLRNAFVDFKNDALSSMIELTSIPRGHKPPAPTNTPSPQNRQVDDECCVTCNGVRACACAVYTSCGECCMLGCC